MPDSRPRTVIVGGGFGGLRCARTLAGEPVRVTLLDRRNFHLFQPLLYQVATGALSPANICAPLRKVLARQENAEVLLAEARGIDPDRRRVLLADGEIPYDHLVLAAGAGTHYFGHREWEPHAPGLKSVEDALEIRRRVLLAFEQAERSRNPETVDACLRFVVVGGGPTGVELAGALAEIARFTLRHEFRRIRARHASILLVEGGPRILPTYPPELSDRARRALEALGVEVLPGSMVRDVGPDRVAWERGGERVLVRARTVLWSAGVRASPLARAAADALGLAVDGGGRLPVEPDGSLPGHPEIHAVGDLARYEDAAGAPLPGTAPVALQQGAHVARRLARIARGREPGGPFRFRDRGDMAVIGRRRAVVRLGRRIRLSGGTAWLLWLGVHLLQIIEFGNRLLILVQWAWNYLTFGRAARLITGEDPGRSLDARHGRGDTGSP